MLKLQSFELDLPTPQELNGFATLRHHVAKKAVAAPGGFICVSLGAWLPRVLAAGVPAVPATRVATLSRDLWLRFDEGLPADAPAWLEFQTACDAAPAGHMLRWDTCGGFGLKMAMGASGTADAATRRDLPLDDPRACDILYTYPADEFSGHIWHHDEYRQHRIYTRYEGRWNNFSHGGTLRDLIKSFCDYIRTGTPIHPLTFGPWPEWTCGGDLCGCGDSMQIVRDAAAAASIVAAPVEAT